MTTHTLEMVDDESLSARVLVRARPTLVLFTARLCLPCTMLASRLPAVADALDGVIDLVRCPVERSPDTTRRYGVTTTPALLLFDRGRLIAARTGVSPLPTIRAWIDTTLAAAAVAARCEQEAP